MKKSYLFIFYLIVAQSALAQFALYPRSGIIINHNKPIQFEEFYESVYEGELYYGLGVAYRKNKWDYEMGLMYYDIGVYSESSDSVAHFGGGSLFALNLELNLAASYNYIKRRKFSASVGAGLRLSRTFGTSSSKSKVLKGGHRGTIVVHSGEKSDTSISTIRTTLYKGNQIFIEPQIAFDIFLSPKVALMFTGSGMIGFRTIYDLEVDGVFNGKAYPTGKYTLNGSGFTFGTGFKFFFHKTYERKKKIK
jgi:hypothetical protein